MIAKLLFNTYNKIQDKKMNKKELTNQNNGDQTQKKQNTHTKINFYDFFNGEKKREKR